LIGGSLAKALAGRAKALVVGIDPDPAVIEKLWRTKSWSGGA